MSFINRLFSRHEREDIGSLNLEDKRELVLSALEEGKSKTVRQISKKVGLDRIKICGILVLLVNEKKVVFEKDGATTYFSLFTMEEDEKVKSDTQKILEK